jgi:hypothetical protein
MGAKLEMNNKIEPDITDIERVVGSEELSKEQLIETLINEEALLFAKFLREERETWNPRIAVL